MDVLSFWQHGDDHLVSRWTKKSEALFTLAPLDETDRATIDDKFDIVAHVEDYRKEHRVD